MPLAMLLVATAHRPLAVTPLERALILAAHRLPGDLHNDFCLPGLGERHRMDTPCDACIVAAARMPAVAPPLPDLPAVAAPARLAVDLARPVAPGEAAAAARAPVAA